MAESANIAPDASPMSVGRMPPVMPPGLYGHDDDTGRRDHDRSHHRHADDIAEEDRAEDRHLDRLGLDVGNDDDERALAHRGEHRAVAAIWNSAPASSHGMKLTTGAAARSRKRS